MPRVAWTCGIVSNTCMKCRKYGVAYPTPPESDWLNKKVFQNETNQIPCLQKQSL